MVDFNPELAKEKFLRVTAPLMPRGIDPIAVALDAMPPMPHFEPVAKCFTVHPDVLNALRTEIEAMAGFPPGLLWGIELRANPYLPRDLVYVAKSDGSFSVLHL